MLLLERWTTLNNAIQVNEVAVGPTLRAFSEKLVAQYRWYDTSRAGLYLLLVFTKVAYSCANKSSSGKWQQASPKSTSVPFKNSYVHWGNI